MGTTEDRPIIPGQQVGVNIIFALGGVFGLGRLRFGLQKLSDWFVKFGVLGGVGL